jgi:hypothetical protein
MGAQIFEMFAPFARGRQTITVLIIADETKPSGAEVIRL